MLFNVTRNKIAKIDKSQVHYKLPDTYQNYSCLSFIIIQTCHQRMYGTLKIHGKVLLIYISFIFTYNEQNTHN